MATEPPEILYVTDHRVSCDGGGGALGHPRVFLELGEKKQVECPYCDRLFILEVGNGKTSAQAGGKSEHT
jgi:uncharacterized Zn-finger protein